MAIDVIATSIFELFKDGPGPSSSHTIGPMKAGFDFYGRCLALPNLHLLKNANIRFEVHLYGSLSATGAGHGADAAIIAGLLGNSPSRCAPGLLHTLKQDRHIQHSVNLGSALALVSFADIIPDSIIHDFPYSNTLRITLKAESGQSAPEVILQEEYYSIGGGFILRKGEKLPERGRPVHPYSNMRQLQSAMRVSGLTIHEIILDNESAITGMGRAAILEKLAVLQETMQDGVRRGLQTQGPLPGPLGVQRKACDLYAKTQQLPLRSDRFLGHLNAYALATAEENADGGLIVTAPTCGAAGVLPALLYAMRYDLTIGDRALGEGLLAAAAIGFLAKHNAAIAGAEVGCQGEIGVASAMAAAMVAHARGASAQTAENAAEIALEHHLGLTCDPVGGYVQIPCIERNAVGAIKAYNAYLLASLENPYHHRVSLDSAIAALAETGREMNAKFKETSLGGLAVSMVNC